MSNGLVEQLWREEGGKKFRDERFEKAVIGMLEIASIENKLEIVFNISFDGGLTTIDIMVKNKRYKSWVKAGTISTKMSEKNGRLRYNLTSGIEGDIQPQTKQTYRYIEFNKKPPASSERIYYAKGGEGFYAHYDRYYLSDNELDNSYDINDFVNRIVSIANRFLIAHEDKRIESLKDNLQPSKPVLKKLSQQLFINYRVLLGIIVAIFTMTMVGIFSPPVFYNDGVQFSIVKFVFMTMAVILIQLAFSGKPTKLPSLIPIGKIIVFGLILFPVTMISNPQPSSAVWENYLFPNNIETFFTAWVFFSALATIQRWIELDIQIGA